MFPDIVPFIRLNLPLFKNEKSTEISVLYNLVAGPDLNRRPSGYEPDELPSCSTRV